MGKPLTAEQTEKRRQRAIEMAKEGRSVGFIANRITVKYARVKKWIEDAGIEIVKKPRVITPRQSKIWSESCEEKRRALIATKAAKAARERLKELGLA